MIILLDFLKFLIPMIITIILYSLYYHILVIGYAKKIKKMIDNNQIEKAERMKRIALKCQPIKMNKLLLKFQVIKKKHAFSDYEIELEDYEAESSSLIIEQQLNKNDVIRYTIWAYIKNIPIALKVLLLISYSIFVLVIIFDSAYISLLIFTTITVMVIYAKWVKLSFELRNYPINVVRIVFDKDKIIYFSEKKTYRLKRENIDKLYVKKKSIYVIMKNNTALIIPRRFIKEDYSTMMEFIKNLKPDYIL